MYNIRILLLKNGNNIHIEGEMKMIVMNIELDNLYAFRDFNMNFSYPKKIVNSFIENEHLQGFPNFRYKKVNILMGANASGKTTLGLAIMSIFNFINQREFSHIEKMIDNNRKEASFTIDFIVEAPKLYRVKVHIIPTLCDEDIGGSFHKKLSISVKSTKIGMRDRYETCANRLSASKDVFKENMSDAFGEIEPFGWFFSYPKDTLDNEKKIPKNDSQFSKILKNVLMSFDTSITDVKESKEVENAYIISLENKVLLMQDGEFVKDEKVLSSGTKASIDIALMIYSIINKRHAFYYCDEKFSYVHSDLEKNFLILMISKLSEDHQLFFTTHNSDILDIQLPKHSFSFMKKVDDGGKKKILCFDASLYMKKSRDSLRNVVDNDLFGISPSLELIYEIEEMK